MTWCFVSVLCNYKHLFTHVLGITYVIENLAPDTAYLVRVASRNQAGLSDWMGPEEFRTQSGTVATTATGATAPGSVDTLHSNNMCFIHLVIAYIVYHRMHN